jgi:hypothetical protein
MHDKTNTVFEILLRPDCLVDETVINLRQRQPSLCRHYVRNVIFLPNTKIHYRHYNASELGLSTEGQLFQNLLKVLRLTVEILYKG